MKLYDYIIIGGGIAGLYANYKLSSTNKCLLLEKNEHFGGRAHEIEFHGSLIKLGAGIMADHNKHLLKLVNKLKLKIRKFSSYIATENMRDFNMTMAICNIVSKYKEVKKTDIVYKLTIKEFLLKYFGSAFTKEFIVNCEYYDFVNSNIEYFVKYYDIYDMTHEAYTTLIIKWTELVDKLVKKNCLNNIEVLNIEKENNMYKIITNNDEYYTKKIVFSTTLNPLIKLTKNIININYKDYLGTVPFMKIYCYFKNGYDLNLSHFTIVNNKLQKIIKVNEKVLMASYSDSDVALYWLKISKLSKNKQISIVTKYLKEFEFKGTISDILIVFWEEGVHYYKPMKNLDKTIKKLSHPTKNIYVVGEIISYKQGWVEGCIESVDRVFK